MPEQVTMVCPNSTGLLDSGVFSGFCGARPFTKDIVIARSGCAGRTASAAVDLVQALSSKGAARQA